jgi:hypothetical protein
MYTPLPFHRMAIWSLRGARSFVYGMLKPEWKSIGLTEFPYGFNAGLWAYVDGCLTRFEDWEKSVTIFDVGKLSELDWFFRLTFIISQVITCTNTYDISYIDPLHNFCQIGPIIRLCEGQTLNRSEFSHTHLICNSRWILHIYTEKTPKVIIKTCLEIELCLLDQDPRTLTPWLHRELKR